MEKTEIGRRIRAVRQRQRLSLRHVAASSGLSATHISEIERGHTFPTVGSLLRVAEALGCQVHLFLEERWLPEVSLVRTHAAPALSPGDERVPRVELLSEGIPGGKIAACRIRFLGATCAPYRPDWSGELAGFVTQGQITLVAGARRFDLSEGDTYHAPNGESHTLATSSGEPAEVILIASSE